MVQDCPKEETGIGFFIVLFLFLIIIIWDLQEKSKSIEGFDEKEIQIRL